MINDKSKFKKIKSFGFLVVVLSFSFLVFSLFPVRADQTVTIQSSIQSYLSVSIDSNTVNMGNLQAGTPVEGTSVVTVTTNNAQGYKILVNRDNSDYTLKSGVNYITDKTVWDSSANEGQGNGSTWSGTGIGFRVKYTGTTSNYNSGWWGSNDSASQGKFAGFPSSSSQIMNKETYSVTSTQTTVGYKCDVPTIQSTGSYAGGITYSIIAN